MKEMMAARTALERLLTAMQEAKREILRALANPPDVACVTSGTSQSAQALRFLTRVWFRLHFFALALIFQHLASEVNNKHFIIVLQDTQCFHSLT
jgi:hypothetical protein